MSDFHSIIIFFPQGSTATTWYFLIEGTVSCKNKRVHNFNIDQQNFNWLESKKMTQKNYKNRSVQQSRDRWKLSLWVLKYFYIRHLLIIKQKKFEDPVNHPTLDSLPSAFITLDPSKKPSRSVHFDRRQSTSD